MEYGIYLALVVVTTIIVKIVLDRRSTMGTLKIDHSDPEKDRYLFDLGDNLDKLSKKKRIILKVDNNADLSHD